MAENISLAFQGIWGHKLRSFLTMLGIIIGIASLITIVATINGTNQQIKENLIGSGTNVINVNLTQNGYVYDFSYSSIPDGVHAITEEDRVYMETLKGVDSVSLFRRRQWVDGVYYKDASFNGNVYGTDAHYMQVNSMHITDGRGFAEEDLYEHHKIAIVDAKAASSLFAGDSAVGSIIEIKGEPFVVVGICAPDTTSEPVINNLQDYYMYMDTSSGTIYIPISCWDIVYKYDEPQSVAIKAVNTDSMATAGDSVSNYLNERVIENSESPYQYKAENLLEQAAALQELSNATNSQLIWIALISLLVGGIGVMNIMLVSVTERTKEIGLKIAIGAKQRRIRIQFLTEAAALTSIGGVLGVIFGIGLSLLLSSVMGTPVSISVPACIVAVVFSMVIGIVFGLVPAIKASKLNPIDALRYE